jgi:hypothetical protein
MVAISKKRGKNDVVARVLAFIAGLIKNQSGETLVLGGVSITVLALIAELQAYIAELNANTAAHAAWLAQTQKTKTIEIAETTRLEQLTHYLEAIYGSASPTLADYGLTPAKPAKRTVKAKAAAVAKDAATRLARDTEGPREKEAIHGTVAPEPAPATPVVPPAPDAAKAR